MKYNKKVFFINLYSKYSNIDYEVPEYLQFCFLTFQEKVMIVIVILLINYIIAKNACITVIYYIFYLFLRNNMHVLYIGTCMYKNFLHDNIALNFDLKPCT